MVKQYFFAQIIIYLLGMLILAFGVSFSIYSNLGTSPVNSLPFVVSIISGINFGTSLTIFFIVCIFLQFILLRKNFKLINIAQILMAFLFGYLANFALFIMEDFMIPTYLGQLLKMFISIFLISFGLAFYLEAKLISLPAEGLVIAILHKFPNSTFHKIKIITDIFIVLSAIIFSLLFLGNMYGVREGTILSAFLIGKFMPFNKKIVEFLLNKCGFYAINK